MTSGEVDFVRIYSFVRAVYSDTYFVSGGSGSGHVELACRTQCGGSNFAVFAKPIVSLSNGTQQLMNAQTGPQQICAVGPAGVLSLPFDFGSTLLTVNFDTIEFGGAGHLEPAGMRGVLASLKIFDADGNELPDAFLVPIPEPGTMALLTAAILADFRSISQSEVMEGPAVICAASNAPPRGWG